MCHRCFQPLPPGARRCPDCRVYLRDYRRLPVVLGVATVLAFVLALLAMVWTAHNEEVAVPEQDTGQVHVDRASPALVLVQ